MNVNKIMLLLMSCFAVLLTMQCSGGVGQETLDATNALNKQATSSKSNEKTSQNDDTELLKSIIKQIENRAPKLNKILTENYNASPEKYPAILEKLLDPILVLEVNKQNLDKIYPEYYERVKTLDRVELKNPNYIFFNFVDEELMQKTLGIVPAASFAAATRIVKLSKSFDANNDFHMVGILFHEIRHAMQDVGVRSLIEKSGANFEKYYAFHTTNAGERPRLDIRWEISAYGYEIELLNLYLNNEFREKVENKTITTDWMIQKLNASEDDRETIEIIISMAKDSYYPHGLQNDMFPEDFGEIIIKHYEEWFDIYALNHQKLTFVPYRDKSLPLFSMW